MDDQLGTNAGYMYGTVILVVFCIVLLLIADGSVSASGMEARG